MLQISSYGSSKYYLDLDYEAVNDMREKLSPPQDVHVTTEYIDRESEDILSSYTVSEINMLRSKDVTELKGKTPRKETASGNIDEGCISMRSEEKLNNKRKSRKSGDKDEKKMMKKKKISEEKESILTGYVHVRARRGQATDSHSLAERVRREKISERMKLLQALVPGCDKATSKALMLDQIINYVQSLQYQVEFLSLKIASVNAMLYDYGMNVDEFIVKTEAQNQGTTTSLEADVQQQNNTQATMFNTSSGYSLVDEEQKHTKATNNIFNTSGDYSLIDTSTLLQLQQAQMSNIMSQSLVADPFII